MSIKAAIPACWTMSQTEWLTVPLGMLMCKSPFAGQRPPAGDRRRSWRGRRSAEDSRSRSGTVPQDDACQHTEHTPAVHVLVRSTQGFEHIRDVYVMLGFAGPVGASEPARGGGRGSSEAAYCQAAVVYETHGVQRDQGTLVQALFLRTWRRLLLGDLTCRPRHFRLFCILHIIITALSVVTASPSLTARALR